MTIVSPVLRAIRPPAPRKPLLLVYEVVLVLSLAGVAGCIDGEKRGPFDSGSHGELIQAGFTYTEGFEVSLNSLLNAGSEVATIEVIPENRTRFSTLLTGRFPMANVMDAGYGQFRVPCSMRVIDGQAYGYWPHLPLSGSYTRTPQHEQDSRVSALGRSDSPNSLILTKAADAGTSTVFTVGLSDPDEWDRRGATWAFHATAESSFYARVSYGGSLNCITDISDTSGGTVATSDSTIRASGASLVESAMGPGLVYVEVGADRDYHVDVRAPGEPQVVLRRSDHPNGLATNTTWFLEGGETVVEIAKLDALEAWWLRAAILFDYEETLHRP